MSRSRLITIGVSATAITAALFVSGCKLPERSTTLNRQPGVASSPNPTCLPIGSPACGANPRPTPTPTPTPTSTPSPTPTPTPTVTAGPPPEIGAPALHFSDITSGPSSGLGDGLGSGAIVTIWGAGLGSSQSNSQILIGGIPAAHVYYWGNADRSGASGPADLYTYHRMQTVSFSIPANAVLGANDIHVIVNGKESNRLSFTVRSGAIYFVAATGNNSAVGSFTSPWQTLDYVGTGAGGRIHPGDIIYVKHGVQDLDGVPIHDLIGTATNPFSLIAYPGALVTIQGYYGYGLGNWSKRSKFWNFSKLIVQTKSTGIDAFQGMRAVANEITNFPAGCADGQSGAISGSNSSQNTTGGIKAFGNYIHNFGCDTTSKLHHVFYLSNRGGFKAESFELGWNYLTDNKAHHALHVYDEGICGDFEGVMRIHDNVVKNQVGVGVGVAGSGYSDNCFTMPVEIYNNLFIDVGQETTACDGHHNQAVSFMKQTTRSHVKMYNNTLYGFGVPGSGYALSVQGTGSADWVFGGVWEFVNNIIVNKHALPFEYPTYWKAADVHANNLWFDPSGTIAAPSWDTGARMANPLFVDPANGVFALQSGSPAMFGGSNTGTIVIRDLYGVPRGIGQSYSIGAFE